MTVGTRSVAGVEVGAIGLGSMNLGHAYGIPPPAERATALLHRALDLGVSHYDTAALYGFGRNEELLGGEPCRVSQPPISSNRQHAAARTPSVCALSHPGWIRAAVCSMTYLMRGTSMRRGCR